MLYLYLGYVVTQLYAITEVFSTPPGAQGQASKVSLFISGVVIALVEHGFSYLNLLTDKQHAISSAIVFLLFFLVAYLPLNNQFLDKIHNSEARFIFHTLQL